MACNQLWLHRAYRWFVWKEGTAKAWLLIVICVFEQAISGVSPPLERTHLTHVIIFVSFYVDTWYDGITCSYSAIIFYEILNCHNSSIILSNHQTQRFPTIMEIPWVSYGMNNGLAIKNLVNVYIAIEHGHRNCWFTHKKMVIFHSYGWPSLDHLSTTSATRCWSTMSRRPVPCWLMWNSPTAADGSCVEVACSVGPVGWVKWGFNMLQPWKDLDPSWSFCYRIGYLKSVSEWFLATRGGLGTGRASCWNSEMKSPVLGRPVTWGKNFVTSTCCEIPPRTSGSVLALFILVAHIGILNTWGYGILFSIY